MPVITEAYVKALKLNGRSEMLVRDTRLPGFALRVRPKADGSLSKLFMALWEEPAAENGPRKRRKASIGEWPVWTAEAAREEATGMLQAAKRGDDPAKARRDKRAAPAWVDLVREFEPHLLAKKPATRKSYRNIISRTLEPAFGKMKIRDITAEDLRRFMKALSVDHPVDANRSLATISVMLGRAVELGWIPANPAIGLKRNQEKAREAWLDERDLPKFVAALAEFEGVHADVIRFAAVTGWRISEVLNLTHEMVAPARAVAELPDTKTGRSIRGLSEDALSIIAKQDGIAGHVFKGRGGGRADYRSCLNVLTEICEKAGVPRITPHVLRHTAATWSAISGASSHELMSAFGWKSVAMTVRYVARSEALSKAGADRAAKAMNILGSKTQ